MHRTHWDHYFVQWCLHWLPELGLQAEGKPRFSQLPLEADMLIVTAPAHGSWHTHPLWRYLSPYTIVEFKSVQDPFETVDWGKLMAYIGLTMEREELSADVEIGGWLIVPAINKALAQVLKAKGLKLTEVLPGLSLGQTGLFPLVVVEYNHLPLEEAFCEVKSFMKKGEGLERAMEMSLRKWMGSKLYQEYTTIITSIHSGEAQAMIEVLEQDKPKFKRMAKLMLEKLGEEAEDLAPVRQAVARGEQRGERRGEQRGRQEGRQEGLDKFRQKIVELLKKRFGSLPVNLAQEIRQLDDFDRLDIALSNALECESLDAFRQTLA